MIDDTVEKERLERNNTGVRPNDRKFEKPRTL